MMIVISGSLRIAHHSLQSQYFLIQCFIATTTGKIIKCLFRNTDNMILVERRTFSCTIFRMFNTAFPFQDSPAGIIILGEFTEDRLKIYLSVAKGTESSG